MPVENDVNSGLYLLVVLVGLFLLTVAICGLAAYFTRFSNELRYLSMEIKRTLGRERKYYIRLRRKLWLSLIPFVKYHGR